jgi:hypothetical protein
MKFCDLRSDEAQLCGWGKHGPISLVSACRIDEPKKFSFGSDA